MKPLKSKGFTLIELMITIVSAGILSLLVALILFLGYLSWRANSAQAQLQRDTALAVRLMAHQIRYSEPADMSVAGSSLTLQNNAVRSYQIAYSRTITGALKCYSNGVDAGFVITKGLTQFAPQLQGDGVLLQMVLRDTNSYIPVTITNRTFITTRNKP